MIFYTLIVFSRYDRFFEKKLKNKEYEIIFDECGSNEEKEIIKIKVDMPFGLPNFIFDTEKNIYHINKMYYFRLKRKILTKPK